jgi:hypothetical protein
MRPMTFRQHGRRRNRHRLERRRDSLELVGVTSRSPPPILLGFRRCRSANTTTWSRVSPNIRFAMATAAIDRVYPLLEVPANRDLSRADAGSMPKRFGRCVAITKWRILGQEKPRLGRDSVGICNKNKQRRRSVRPFYVKGRPGAVPRQSEPLAEP